MDSHLDLFPFVMATSVLDMFVGFGLFVGKTVRLAFVYMIICGLLAALVWPIAKSRDY